MSDTVKWRAILIWTSAFRYMPLHTGGTQVSPLKVVPLPLIGLLLYKRWKFGDSDKNSFDVLHSVLESKGISVCESIRTTWCWRVRVLSANSQAPVKLIWRANSGSPTEKRFVFGCLNFPIWERAIILFNFPLYSFLVLIRKPADLVSQSWALSKLVK